MISQPSVIRGRSNGVDALWRRTRSADAPETYLVLFGNARIAKLAAVALPAADAGRSVRPCRS